VKQNLVESELPIIASGVARIRRRLRLGQRLRGLRYLLGLEPTLTTTYLGHVFLYHSDSLIGRQIANGAEWDPILRPLITALLPKEQPTICEVGSNIGASLLQILAAKPRATVFAFEPSERFRPLLLKNLAAAGAGRVEVLPLLLGRRPGQVWLHNNTSSASVKRSEYDGHQPRGGQLAEMSTLDQALESLDALDLLKIDTDGYDFEVLRGGERLLGRLRPVIFFELAVQLLDDAKADLMWLQSQGYRNLVCFSSTPQRLVGVTRDPVEALRWAQRDGLYCDVLACHDGSAAFSRVAGIRL
jgi:FkbM family methyltransferase